MYENDDVMLPDDFEEVSTDTPTDNDDFELSDDEFSELEESGAQEESEEENEWALPIKYNGEEQQLSKEDAIRYAQMGMNYDKVHSQLEELRNDPRLGFVEELARENGYDDVNEFVSEFRQMQEQSRIDELIQNNIPEEYAREMIENQKFRQQFQEIQQKQQQEQREQAEYIDFFEAFRGANDRDFNPEKDQIPQEVLDIRQQKNIPLRYAYMEFQQTQMKNQLAVYKQNESNGKRSTISGGITKHGSGDSGKDAFLEGFDSDDGW